MSDEATETRLRELELTAAKAETALALSKWLIGGLCGAFAVIIVSMGYIFFHKRVDELVSDSADTYLKNIFGVNLGQFIKKINDVDEAIKHTEGFVFIGQVQSFPSGPNDCQSFGEPGTTVCLASCPDAEHWVLLSGECGIRGKGDGGTGYLQNIGTRNDKVPRAISRLGPALGSLQMVAGHIKDSPSPRHIVREKIRLMFRERIR